MFNQSVVEPAHSNARGSTGCGELAMLGGVSFTELPHSKSCFVCGSRNPVGLNLRFESDGKILRSRFTLCGNHCGFLGVVHGGVLATVLDEIMVWGVAVQLKQFSYCAEMTVRYLAPGRPDVVIIGEAEMTENKRGKLFLARGELKYDDGTVIATSTGKYMPVRGVDMKPWMEDFEGTPEQLKRILPADAVGE